MTIVLEGLEDSFDNERAEEMLNLSIGRITHTSELVRKSMYDFDLDTPEGIARLMALLPIMDPEILKDIMTELWPGYPTDIDARRHRLEIKGYLKDYLDSNDQEDASSESEELEGVEGSEEGSGNPEGEATGQIPQQVQGADQPATGGLDANTPPAQPGAGQQTEVAPKPGA
jgi:hypothetical protein